ncbi:MAG: hypothetical protein KGK01_11080 [Bradyrhizobium sp.]|uniref:hypothetical protein n=1 Tax=Bradyrhizobium sp. TaxID=376 RepID=UPI001C28E494|nr:hypothetical protein [Bradyrhizobium sp.]MBU6464504.1 hypothetical protein [Pseudomonadota bacterium]MDE2069182.1 hypothetical protein [Bradyrhizobium sp.]MDE2242957.1 hypothetical protein [Bradyrhizobium sp.]
MVGRPSMNSTLTKFAAAVAASWLVASAQPSRAEDPAPKGDRPASVTVISPIFGQLVRFAMPQDFVTVFERTRGRNYIREAVPKGETTEHWTQMMTVTGVKGLTQFTPQGFASAIGGGFKNACPETFAAKDLGATKLGDQDAFVVVLACGKVNSSADGHSEMVLLVVVKGSADGYTVQWAERGPTQTTAPAIDDAKWQERLHALMPIRFCAIVAGEAPPYPSCLGQK